MKKYNEKNYYINTPEYDRHFWDAMRGETYVSDTLSKGVDNTTGGFTLPSGVDDRLSKAIRRESVFRNLATFVKVNGGSSTIFAKDCDDLAMWVPENGSIPVYDGMNDFTRYPVEAHKLAVLVKLDTDFVGDVAFDIEGYLTGRLAKNFARAEDRGYITGTGTDMPLGILDETAGAETGVTTDTLTYDDVIRLYFSLDKEYRPGAVWLMNDETALALRRMKDDAGHPLWNPSDSQLLCKPVFIANDMPSVEAGMTPIVFGDFRYYWIIERSPASVRVLKERFTLLDQIGYLATEFLDGRLIRREALQGLKIDDSQAGT